MMANRRQLLIGFGATLLMGGIGGIPTNFFNGSPEAVEQDDPNLVELVVYGIASLYERYPPKQAADASNPTGKP